MRDKTDFLDPQKSEVPAGLAMAFSARVTPVTQ